MLFISTGIFDDKLRPPILSVGTTANDTLSVCPTKTDSGPISKSHSACMKTSMHMGSPAVFIFVLCFFLAIVLSVFD
jgi:hypothetical protein